MFYKGKNWGELSHLERAELAKAKPELYAEMRANWQELKESLRARMLNERDPNERAYLRGLLEGA